MRPLQLRHASPSLAAAVLIFTFAVGTLRAASPVAAAAQGDFTGLVDIGGGRRLWHGQSYGHLGSWLPQLRQDLERGPPPVEGNAVDGSCGRGRFHPCLRL